MASLRLHARRRNISAPEKPSWLAASILASWRIGSNGNESGGVMALAQWPRPVAKWLSAGGWLAVAARKHRFISWRLQPIIWQWQLKRLCGRGGARLKACVLARKYQWPGCGCVAGCRRNMLPLNGGCGFEQLAVSAAGWLLAAGSSRRPFQLSQSG